MMDNILSEHSARQYSPLTLAFLGDAVYSELVRRRLVMTANMSVKKLHPKSVEYVRAGYQARAYDVIQDILTEAEADILRRGRNASPSNSSIPKSSTPEEYHKATAVESLFGYLSLTGQKERIEELFAVIWENTDKKEI
ncbi:MAG: ribonuclease III [Oscillospiraceae bacterium]|nr:ribonuclease III [Oscillospiraceae bacterium]